MCVRIGHGVCTISQPVSLQRYKAQAIFRPFWIEEASIKRVPRKTNQLGNLATATTVSSETSLGWTPNTTSCMTRSLKLLFPSLTLPEACTP